MTNYYVYYRVEAARLEGIRASVQKIFDKIENETGVRGRWMHRRDDPTTYMEIYEGVADDNKFEALLAQEAAGLGVERRVEKFVCA